MLQNVHFHHNMHPHTGTNHAINGTLNALEVSKSKLPHEQLTMILILQMHMLFVLPEYDHNQLAAFAAGDGNSLELCIHYRLTNNNNPSWSLVNNLMLSQPNLMENQTITSPNNLGVWITDFIPVTSTFSVYKGSLVFFRCPEVQTWIVYDEAMEFDTADLGMRHWTYQSNGKIIPFHRNIRHVQSLNDRPVYSACDGGQMSFFDPILSQPSFSRVYWLNRSLR